MKSFINYPIRVIAAGFVVLAFLSILLFWFRSLCRISLFVRIPGDKVVIQPSGFIAREIEEDPNLVSKSLIIAEMNPEHLLMRLGILDYLESVSPGGRRSNVFVAKSEENWVYFDKESGQIVCRYNQAEMMPDKDRLYREVQYYVGPEGISEVPDETLGLFSDPIIDRSWLGWTRSQEALRDLILYDAKLKRFFRIDFDKTTVVKGPELNAPHGHEPVQVGLLDKSPSLLDVSWMPPAAKILNDDRVYGMHRGRDSEPIIRMAHYGDAVPYLPVLDKSGKIALRPGTTGYSAQCPQLRRQAPFPWSPQVPGGFTRRKGTNAADRSSPIRGDDRRKPVPRRNRSGSDRL